jgi:hypothetical protein
MTSVPVEGLPIAGTPGQIPQTEAIAGVATPGSGLAVTGQIGQAIIAVPQEIGQALVDCATGGTGQAGDSQLPSSGQAVCGGEAPEGSEGSAAGEPHGPPPTPMQTPAPLPVEPEVLPLPLTAEALDTGGAAAEAPPELWMAGRGTGPEAGESAVTRMSLPLVGSVAREAPARVWSPSWPVP